MKNKELNNEFLRVAIRVSVVCMICNALLCVVKAVGGFAAGSRALISDAVNSLFDVLSGLIVLIGAKLSRLESDSEHPYGHERYENVATIILAVILFVTAVFMGHTAIEDMVSGSYKTREVPGVLSVFSALISIITKEILFWYTMGNAKKVDSLALKAAAWDHRADVISTGGALIGIAATRFGFALGDLIASLIVCAFIIRTAYMVFRESIGQMVDRSCDESVLSEMRESIEAEEGVLKIDMLQVRTFGNRLYVDLEIAEDGNVTLRESHEVAERVHDMIEKKFPAVKHIMVHVNPAEEKKED